MQTALIWVTPNFNIGIYDNNWGLGGGGEPKTSSYQRFSGFRAIGFELLCFRMEKKAEPTPPPNYL